MIRIQTREKKNMAERTRVYDIVKHNVRARVGGIAVNDAGQSDAARAGDIDEVNILDGN
jgi:hypothetical protein